jgi:hypothetical protein
MYILIVPLLAYIRLIEAAKALATRNYVKGISRLLALSNTNIVTKLIRCVSSRE